MTETVTHGWWNERDRKMVNKCECNTMKKVFFFFYHLTFLSSSSLSYVCRNTEYTKKKFSFCQKHSLHQLSRAILQREKKMYQVNKDEEISTIQVLTQSKKLRHDNFPSLLLLDSFHFILCYFVSSLRFHSFIHMS